MLVSYFNVIDDKDMSTVTPQSLTEYLGTTLHQTVEITRWQDHGVPVFLTKRYQLLAGEIGHSPCLFAVDQVGGTPSEIRKHMALLRGVHDGIVIYVVAGLSSDRRARLIAAGEPFVVPGNQLYIPELALDLREHFRPRTEPAPDQLSPAAQAVLFYRLLNNHDDKPLTPTSLAKPFYYTTMTLGRAFDELHSLELGRVERQGRSKELIFEDTGRSLLRKARPFLRSPVHSIRYVHKLGHWFRPIPLSGLSGLASLTDLAPPTLKTLAIYRHDWRGVSDDTELKEVADADDANYCLELWHYAPRSLCGDNVVDPLSLYAQFWNSPDERVAAAAEQLVETLAW